MPTPPLNNPKYAALVSLCFLSFQGKTWSLQQRLGFMVLQDTNYGRDSGIIDATGRVFY